MRFSIVSPVRNAEGLVAETARSIVTQSLLKDPTQSIQWILVDGASSDRSVEVAREEWVPRRNATLTIISEPDNGLYDALRKGLALADGDVVSYINAGDYYSTHCLDVVSKCMELPRVEWLTGMAVNYTVSGSVFRTHVPPPYSRRAIAHGFHSGRGAAGFLQQESTFWRRELLSERDLEILPTYRLAGDAYLWRTLSRRANLFVVEAYLGGFRQHDQQLSEDQVGYRAEALGDVPVWLPGYPIGLAHRILSAISPGVRAKLGLARRTIRYDPHQQGWVLAKD